MIIPTTFLKPSPSTSSLSMYDGTTGSIMGRLWLPSPVGSIAETTLDLNRAKIRLEGLSTYGFLSVILVNCALTLYFTVPKNIISTNENNYNRIENVIKILFSWCTIISILTSFNTAIIFSLISLYGKTALGMTKDTAFIAFMSSTASVRSLGFKSMLIALMGLKFSFALSVYLFLKGKIGSVFSGCTWIISILSLTIWIQLIQKATIVFT